MAAKRFQPVLNEIPEEETYPSNRNSIELYQGLGSQRSGSVVSLKRENSRKRSVSCVGCPGCKSDSTDVQNFMKFDVPACSNCLSNKGDKQNSIRKWLENIPIGKQQPFYNDFSLNANQNGLVNSLLSLPVTETRNNKLRKQNSFSATNSMYSADNLSIPKKSSTMSVRSEPGPRNYNLPLPEFENLDFAPNNYNSYCQTVSRVDDIRPIGLSDYHSGSLRSNILANQRRNKFITNKNALPDMVNEAIALDHCSKSYNQSSSDEERFDSKIPNSIAQQTYSRNTSESPLGNDYETDSLERNSHKKGISTPTDYADLPSSQASPSLSNALPLEEELTMRNAVYKHSSSNSNTPSPQRDIFIDQNHYETIGKQKNNQAKPLDSDKLPEPSTDYSLVSEVYVNNNYNFGSTPTSPSGSECSMGSRKLKENNEALEEKPGCLTIEVKDSPENYIKIHESDGFEPDTLDRKHPKNKEIVETVQFSRKDLLKNIDSNNSPSNQRILLRSSGTFTKTIDKVDATKFNSLRNEYEYRKNTNDRPRLSPTMFSGSKSLEESTDDTWEDAADWTTEEGRILTLEVRHSKRQRQSTPPTIKQLKNLARPDILPPLPPTEDPIYEQPAFPPRRVEIDRLPIENRPKNVTDRSLSPRIFMKKPIETIVHRNSIPHESHYGPSCSPLRASVESQSSEYQNLHPVKVSQEVAKVASDSSRTSSRRPSRSFNSNNINTNTFVKGPKVESHNHKPRFRRKKGLTVEDSGYLSSDSTSSRQMPRKIVVAKIVSCSESDDTENEARSESGAESIETHSVYFGSFRKLQNAENNGANFNNIRNVRNSSSKDRLSKDF